MNYLLYNYVCLFNGCGYDSACIIFLFDFTLSYHVIGVDDFLDVYALDLM